MPLTPHSSDNEQELANSWIPLSTENTSTSYDTSKMDLHTLTQPGSFHRSLPSPPISEPLDPLRRPSPTIPLSITPSPTPRMLPTPETCLPSTSTLSVRTLSKLSTSLSLDPFQGLKCMYCCPSRSCPGGPLAKCFKAPLRSSPIPNTIPLIHEYLEVELAEVVHVEASFLAYVRKLKQHCPYSPEAMRREEEAAAEAVCQLSVLAHRLWDLKHVVAELREEGAEDVPEVLSEEIQRCRGWAEHLWGKMVKNHECLKLNFVLTFEGLY
ncbi:MAG: hypothetical protein MMC23_007281 [Stictis urceolatum]|nr:hypothetical protein [Stictis urceolata]